MEPVWLTIGAQRMSRARAGEENEGWREVKWFVGCPPLPLGLLKFQEVISYDSCGKRVILRWQYTRDVNIISETREMVNPWPPVSRRIKRHEIPVQYATARHSTFHLIHFNGMVCLDYTHPETSEFYTDVENRAALKIQHMWRQSSERYTAV